MSYKVSFRGVLIDTIVEVQITAHEKLSVKKLLLCGKAKEGEFPASIKSNVKWR